jgi:hypothetical protein
LNRKIKENETPMFGFRFLDTIKYIPPKSKIILPLQRCIERIEKSIKEEGLYRESASHKVVQRLIKLYNRGDDPDLSAYNVYVSTSIVTSFFNDMPVAIFKYENVLEELLKLQSADLPNDEINLQIKELLKKLPEETQSCLYSLFSHFKVIIQNSAHNKMTIRNIAIIFGPCLFKCIQNGYGTQNFCVERLLTYYDSIFF